MTPPAAGRFLLDTNILSEAVKPQPSPALLECDAAVERWLREDVVAGHQEYLADSSKGVPAEEVLPRIKARRGARKGRWDLVRVVFTPLAERQIDRLYSYIAEQASEERGSRIPSGHSIALCSAAAALISLLAGVGNRRRSSSGANRTSQGLHRRRSRSARRFARYFSAP